MATASNLIFHHRLNSDGSTDSICPVCFGTVASVMDPSELAFEELNHICTKSFLADRGLITPRRRH
jgi:hypothetical protein